MKKLALLLLAAALALAACGGASSATAATVDDTAITVGDVEALIDNGESTIPKDQFAQFLGFEIQWEIILDAVSAEWGVEFTDEEVSAEADRIYQAASNEGESRDDFLSSRGVTEEFLNSIARQALVDQAVRDELQQEVEPPTDEEIQQGLEEAEGSLTEVCVSHILVPTEEEAQAVLDRLEEGEEFGALATELSQDPASAENNGILPCGNAGQYVDEFREAALTAPVGEVHDAIVETQFGFHVLQVTDRTEPDPADVPSEEEISEQLGEQAVALELNEWFLDVIAAADVTVEEEYGTWQAVPEPTVIPPAA